MEENVEHEYTTTEIYVIKLDNQGRLKNLHRNLLQLNTKTNTTITDTEMNISYTYDEITEADADAWIEYIEANAPQE